jgi:hypothetical protein
MFHTNLPARLSCLLGLLLISGVFSASQAEAGNARSSLRGRVLDQNGAAIPGAKVVAKATTGSGSVSAITDQNGEFALLLEPGEYTVRVTVNGFSDAAQTIRLNQGSNPFFEVILQVSGAVSSVTVVDVGGYQTDAIGSATKTLTPLRDIPQSITILTNEQIKDQMHFRYGTSIRSLKNWAPASGSSIAPTCSRRLTTP